MKIIKLIATIAVSIIIHIILIPFRLVEWIFALIESVSCIIKLTTHHFIELSLNEVFKTKQDGKKHEKSKEG